MPLSYEAIPRVEGSAELNGENSGFRLGKLPTKGFVVVFHLEKVETGEIDLGKAVKNGGFLISAGKGWLKLGIWT